MATNTNLLNALTKGRDLPEGCDAWGIRAVRPDGASRHGFVWPLAPGWVEAPGPIDYSNTDPCPADVGDGICLAHSWGGMALGGIVARTLLLCAYSVDGILGDAPGGDIIRLGHVHVAAVIDGERLIREHGRGADLRGADLRGADLRGADLTGADLNSADLNGADLNGADLTDAHLNGADLNGADLRGAYLLGADLNGAHLNGANLWCANLSDANLSGADLRGADLTGADLRGVDLGDWELDSETGFARRR